jgi:hypothetical protein
MMDDNDDDDDDDECGAVGGTSGRGSEVLGENQGPYHLVHNNRYMN